jgi:hypothetical protein
VELETIRMSATAAADATIGINAMIDALPLDGADTRPPHVTVYNSVDHPWVARREFPEQDPNITYPAVAVMLAQQLVVREVMTSNRDAEATVLFAYIERASDSAKLTRDTLYTNRAMLRFLTRFSSNASGSTFRSRGGVLMINPIKTDQGTTKESWGNATMVAATMVTWLIRDSAA